REGCREQRDVRWTSHGPQIGKPGAIQTSRPFRRLGAAAGQDKPQQPALRVSARDLVSSLQQWQDGCASGDSPILQGASNMQKLSIRTALALLPLIAACSDDKPANMMVSKLVTAAAGGTVTVGSASLVIPPGALAADTTITVATSAPPSSLPQASTLQGS